ncbi:hypothetical protein [Sphingomonas sp.]|uniref:hypothetical protein n=1 Tax=Sphingomonas sp. TaxID=28214 RepID=UPI0025E7FACE|nr:hypothetical protein [Sphingomonas sp.]
MTALRDPDGCGHAMRRIEGQLGSFEAVAAVVGRSVGCVSDWASDARTACPSWAQAIALDAAYRAAGGEGAPLYEAYGKQLDMSLKEMTACHAALAEQLAEATKEVGEALGAAMRLTVPGFSLNQARIADIELDEAETRFKGLRRLIKSFVLGAGPGKSGGAQ